MWDFYLKWLEFIPIPGDFFQTMYYCMFKTVAKQIIVASNHSEICWVDISLEKGDQIYNGKGISLLFHAV